MAKRKIKTKNCITKHFRLRLAQRFDIYLSDQEISDLINQIHTNKAKCIDRQSNTRTIWELDIHGKRVIAIYDKPRKGFVTVLPECNQYKG